MNEAIISNIDSLSKSGEELCVRCRCRCSQCECASAVCLKCGCSSILPEDPFS